MVKSVLQGSKKRIFGGLHFASFFELFVVQRFFTLLTLRKKILNILGKLQYCET